MHSQQRIRQLTYVEFAKIKFSLCNSPVTKNKIIIKYMHYNIQKVTIMNTLI